MQGSVKKAVLIALTFLLFGKAHSQEALITLKDSLKIKTELVAIKGIYLTTKSGTLGINEIYSLRFASEAELEKNEELSRDLLNTGIIIYVDGQKLTTIQSDEWAKKLQVEELMPPTPEKFREDVELASFGLGIGLDYGGLGGRFTFQATPNLGVFIAGGYAIAGFGVNGGVRGRLNPEKSFNPTLTVMYGYNAAIQITGSTSFNKLYYGTSVGLGFEKRVKTLNKDFYQIEIIVPFRSAEYDADIARFQSILTSSIPLLISGGYHFVIRSREGIR